MNLQDQVTSLELSKRLKELGVEQQSLFYWIKKTDHLETIRVAGIIYLNDLLALESPPEAYDICSAFTAAEMLQFLPVGVVTENHEPFNTYRLSIWKSLIVKDPMDMVLLYHYAINYECDTHLATDAAWNKRFLTKNMHDENPANAFAQMMIFLYENGLMK